MSDDTIYCPKCRAILKIDGEDFEEGPNPYSCPDCGAALTVVQEWCVSHYAREMDPGEFDV